MNFRTFSLPRIWGILSRTRPFAPQPKLRPKQRTPKGLCRYFGSGFWYILYQGLGVTAPFGLFYTIGVVVGGIGGNGISIAIIVAMVTSLLTGLCYTELITSNRQASGNASTAIYQLVGEFPAYCAAVLNFMVSSCCFAALCKALSSTMEELSDERLSAFLTEIIGDLPLSGVPPDVLALGAALVTSVLLACGLKQAGVLRASMNFLCLFGFIFFLCVGGTHTRTLNTKFEGVISNSPRQVLAGAGLCCCLFFQYLEIGRRSKGERRPRYNLPLSISVSKGGVLLTSLTLGLLLSFMMDNRFPVSGAPLLRALKLREVEWARLFVGSIQIVILGLGISEAGEGVSKQLVSMASEGFIPAFVSFECPFSFSYSRAHLISGVWSAFLAVFLTHVFLLEFMAANILLLNSLIVIITLYRPYRCPNDSLIRYDVCSVAVTSTSKRHCATSSTRLHDSKFSLNNAASDRTILFFKSGLRVLSCSNPLFKPLNEDELSTPLFSSSDSVANEDEGNCSKSKTNKENGVFVDADDTSEQFFKSEVKCKANVMSKQPFDRSKLSHKSTVQEKLLPPTNVPDDSASNFVVNDIENVESKDEPISSGRITPDEDIDLIVSEYKEQLRISKSNSRPRQAPTSSTAKRALLSIVCLIIASISLSCISLQISNRKDENQSFIFDPQSSLIFINILLIIGFLVFLGRLPLIKTSASTFQLPASPWLTFITLLLNIILVTEIISRTFWLLLPIIFLGIIWYVFYSSKHSVAATHFYKHLEEFGPKPNERVCLSPSFMPARFYTLKPQTDTTINRII